MTYLAIGIMVSYVFSDFITTGNYTGSICRTSQSTDLPKMYKTHTAKKTGSSVVSVLYWLKIQLLKCSEQQLFVNPSVAILLNSSCALSATLALYSNYVAFIELIPLHSL